MAHRLHHTHHGRFNLQSLPAWTPSVPASERRAEGTLQEECLSLTTAVDSELLTLQEGAISVLAVWCGTAPVRDVPAASHH